MLHVSETGPLTKMNLLYLWQRQGRDKTDFKYQGMTLTSSLKLTTKCISHPSIKA